MSTSQWRGICYGAMASMSPQTFHMVLRAVTYTLLHRYPPYPSMYNINWSKKANLDRIMHEPGYPKPDASLEDTFELDDDIPDDEPEVTGTPYAAADYDEWYRPIIDAASSIPTSDSVILPAITQPPEVATLPPAAVSSAAAEATQTPPSSTTESESTPPFPSPFCLPAALGGFDVDKAFAALGDFCSQTATVEAGADPISKVYNGG